MPRKKIRIKRGRHCLFYRIREIIFFGRLKEIGSSLSKVHR